MKTTTTKAPMNRSVFLDEDDIANLDSRLFKNRGQSPVSLADILNRTICGDSFELLEIIPDSCVDLLIADPPYNLTKTFNSSTFKSSDMDSYQLWLDSWVSKLPRILKPQGSIYICGDWRSSTAIYYVLEKYFYIQNRITWEREKGRGSRSNWKNAHEDIWFATMDKTYTFNVDAVKLRRRVIAPYKVDGQPKDWSESESGNFRLTHPSNMFTDLSVPFWSMPENTEHPTQKPEKLIAKLILASSNPGELVFDPFLGSGTTSVTAKKLDRNYIGIEADKTFCLLAEKRLQMAETDKTIQGYHDGVFWERNSKPG